MKGRSRLRSLLLALGIASSLAAGAEGASVFNREGWGGWWDQADPAAQGRGGTSVAFAGYGASGETNPATTAATDMSFGYASWNGDVNHAKGEAGSFSNRSDFLPHIGGVIVLPQGMRAFALLRMQTDAAYDRTQHFDSAVSGPFELETKGEGGWNRLELGASGPAFDRRLLWGVAVSRIMGSAREELTYTFADTGTAAIRNTIDARLAGGWMGTGGIVLRPVSRLSLGAAGTLGGSSRVTQEVRSIQGGTYDVSTTARQAFPSQWAFGIDARALPRLGVSADIVRTLWGSAAFRPAGGPDTYPFAQTTRWGAGLEYAAPASEIARPKSASIPRWIARAGYAHDESYVVASDGSRIDENAVTLGLTTRAARGRAAIDFGLAIGKRGDSAKLGVEESFYRLSVGVSFSSTVREY